MRKEERKLGLRASFGHTRDLSLANLLIISILRASNLDPHDLWLQSSFGLLDLEQRWTPSWSWVASFDSIEYWSHSVCGQFWGPRRSPKEAKSTNSQITRDGCKLSLSQIYSSNSANFSTKIYPMSDCQADLGLSGCYFYLRCDFTCLVPFHFVSLSSVSSRIVLFCLCCIWVSL